MIADDVWTALRAHGVEVTDLVGLIASVTARGGSVVTTTWHLPSQDPPITQALVSLPLPGGPEWREHAEDAPLAIARAYLRALDRDK